MRWEDWLSFDLGLVWHQRLWVGIYKSSLRPTIWIEKEALQKWLKSKGYFCFYVLGSIDII